jgi:hypothetical protein
MVPLTVAPLAGAVSCTVLAALAVPRAEKTKAQPSAISATIEFSRSAKRLFCFIRIIVTPESRLDYLVKPVR